MSAPATLAPIAAQSVAIEQHALGALLVDGSAIARVNGLRVEHFVGVGHREIFRAILDCAEDDGLIDLVTVGERLRRNGAADDGIFAYLGSLAQHVPSAANVEKYAELVIEHARRRAYVEVGRELVASAESRDSEDLRRDLLARLAQFDTPDEWPAALDLRALAKTEPQRPEHIVPEWFPAGEVTLFAGHGGGGKSEIAMQLGADIALGTPWCGLPVPQRPVLFLSAEDAQPVAHWRLTRIAAHRGIALGDLAGHLDVIDASHINCELMLEPGRGDEPILTSMYDALARRISDPRTVLILDGVSDLFGASEIVRRHVRRFIRALRLLIGPHGAVLLLAHVDKAAARDGATSDRYSGSTAWHNSVRARWSLSTAEDGTLTLTLAKANHAQAGAEIRFRWDPVAHLHVADQAPAEGGIVARIRERTERDGIVAAMRACAAAAVNVPAVLQGARNAYSVLRARPELPDSMRAGSAGRRLFLERLEELRQNGAIIEREIRRKNRHSSLVLTLADIGGAPDAP